ncbi:MAG TPA: hypothetical protein VD794_09100 [Flavisolibacter sp.]|nr:hypothetical protein [Flavisolibacter sp.]
MTPENIKTLLHQTQKLMYGLNYEVTLGLEVFDNCTTLDEAAIAIKNSFPSSNINTITPVLVSIEDFWAELTEMFDYRGDDIGVSLKLNERQEIELKAKQNDIKAFVSQYLQKVALIYSYSFLEGISGYPVFWEFAYVIIDGNGSCVFFYGSASD